MAGVGTGLVAVERNSQFAPRRKFDTTDHAGRQGVNGTDIAALRVIEFEQRTAGLIDLESNPATVLADIEIGDIPDFLVNHRFENRRLAIDDA